MRGRRQGGHDEIPIGSHQGRFEAALFVCPTTNDLLIATGKEMPCRKTAKIATNETNLSIGPTLLEFRTHETCERRSFAKKSKLLKNNEKSIFVVDGRNFL